MQKIEIAIPTRTSPIINKLAAVVFQLIVGLPGRKVRGIKLYQPAPKPETGDKNINTTANFHHPK